MELCQIEYLIHGNILPMSITKHRMSEKLVLEKVYGEGYQDSTWGANVGHVKAYVGMEFDSTAAHFHQAHKYLTLFLHLYTLQAGQPYVVFRPSSIPIVDFTKLGERTFSYPSHNPIKSLGKPLQGDVQYISKLKSLFQQVESNYVEIFESLLGLAMQFFYDAVMSNHRRRLELAVVQFIMSAEALVVRKPSSLTQNVSKRIGVLSSNTLDEYELIYKNMKELYGVRCGIVHGGGKKASPKNVQSLFQYLRKAIFERLSLRQLTKQELVKKLDKISENWEFKTELNKIRQFDWQKM